MKCVLLCAGYATRMYPLTENYAKPLLPIKGKPIIDYLIEDLETKKYISQYIIVSNHKFINQFNKWKQTRHENILVLDDGSTENDNRLGAVKDIEYAIKNASINDDIIVLAGDNLLDFSLNGFIEFFETHKNSCIMYYEENNIENLKKTGVITIKDSIVTSFEEKPKQPKSKNAVPPFYIFNKENLPTISKGVESGCSVDSPGMFIEWFCTQTNIYVWSMPGKRFDIGSLETYNKLK